MFITFLKLLLLSTAFTSAVASSEKLADALGRMEVILTTENKSPVVPVLTWQRLKKFEEKLYFTIAHDPAGVVAADVPRQLLSSKLTVELMSDWSQLSTEAEFYGINDSVPEWMTFKKIFLTMVDYRNQYLFNQSRKPLKSGAMTKSIEDLSRYWSKKWYQENPKFIVSYDLQQMNELKSLVSASRVEAIRSLRAPASLTSGRELSLFQWVFLLLLSSASFYFIGRRIQKARPDDIQKTSAPVKSILSESFDYEAWVKEFSTGIDALARQQDASAAHLKEFSEVANVLRELRVGIMMSTSEEEYLMLTQRLIDTGLKLEDLLNQMAGRGNSEIFDQLMKTVIRLCMVIEKKQEIENLLAA